MYFQINPLPIRPLAQALQNLSVPSTVAAQDLNKPTPQYQECSTSVYQPTEGDQEAYPMDENIRVLVIEDDPSVAEMYRVRLETDGYDVLVGRDGEEGLHLALSEVPEFIYLDLRLPKLDGFEVLQRLRSAPVTAQIPVIILSNYGDPETRERGLSLGALDFLVKADTTPRQLAARVEQTTGVTAA
jgi:CheY-like chemotaxis protein